MRALLHRRLVVEQGRSEAPGRPILYGTGFEFLERFGLASLEELPVLDLDIASRLVDGDGDDAAPEAIDGDGAGEPAAGGARTGGACRSRRRGLTACRPSGSPRSSRRPASPRGAAPTSS